MRVVMNQSAALRMRTGIGHYTGQLLRCLGELGGDLSIDAFPHGPLRGVYELWGRLRPRLEAAGNPHGVQTGGPAPRRRAWRGLLVDGLRRSGRAVLAWQFRTCCSRKRYDLYHEPNFIPLPSDLPTVATLHDLSVLRHPEWHPADRVKHFERCFRQGLTQCCHFLAISEFGKRELVKLLGIPARKITRTYMGVRPGLGVLPGEQVAAALRRLGLPPRYLLCLGTIEPRKNVLRLLQAYCALPQSLRDRWPLLLVGSWGWNTAAVAEYYQSEARHRGVVHLGYLPEADLAAVYNGARALLYPTLYEGFGMPPLEMMACGGAVLASRAEPIVETVGRYACLIDPEDVGGWRDAMARLVSDEDWWRMLRDGVTAVARAFTWEQCAADTLRAYRLIQSGTNPDGRLAA